MQSVSRSKSGSKDSLVILGLVYFKVVLWNMYEFVCVLIRYYPNLRFCLTDLSLSMLYFFKNPFRISREFLQKRGEKNIYAFGQTPLTTMDLIARQCGLTSKDVVYELGCGTGRSCFWLQRFVGCRVVGIDYLPIFIQRASLIERYFRVERIHFKEEDLFKTDFRSASVIYLYGTNFDDKAILSLVGLFRQVKRGTKVITVSYPLTDYTKEPLFRLSKQFKGSFPWGKTTIYLQIKQ